MPLLKNDRIYTYKDYLNWPENERWEILDGIAYAMAPPTINHQRVLGKLYRKLANYCDDKPCEPFIAPFAVTFSEINEGEDAIKTVVEPDIAVVCDKSKLSKKGCKGAPDMIIEILSPSTASVDMIKKRALYERHGVKEYWLVHPVDKTLMVYRMTDGQYKAPDIYSDDEQVSVSIFENLTIDLAQVFENLDEE